MFPWGHAAVGYLLYAALSRHRTGRNPGEAAVLALAVGTQFPDLVDKPLAWYVGVLPSGRSLGHSIFLACVLLAIAHRIATRYDRGELSVAFALGYLTHLLGDVVYPIFRGEFDAVGLLLWPIVSQPGANTDQTILEVLLGAVQTPIGLFEAALFLLATALWLVHRAPGLWLCLRGLRALAPNR